jgi:two-component system sensor histidine kinase AlgZ
MDEPDTGFLPDFCKIRSVFTVVVTGELLVFVLVLVRPAAGWVDLGLMSLFVQWIVLSSAALLCVLRPALARVRGAVAGTLSYLLVLAVTAVVSLAAALLLEPQALGASPGSFVLRSVAVGAIGAAVVLRYLYVQHEWRQRLQSAADARIDALQARIRPHFLFNSLNTIASLIPAAPELAERLVEDLADLFRASLGRSDRLVPLAEELELVDGYLRMEHQRMGPRLRVERELDGIPLDALIPPLTLQPLLENAVYHGVEPRENGGVVRICGEQAGDEIRIHVSNPLAAGERSRRGGAGIAQANVRERLALAFGRRGALEAGHQDRIYHVMVRFPYRPRGVNEDTHRGRRRTRPQPPEHPGSVGGRTRGHR